jgi:hypothetical protein
VEDAKADVSADSRASQHRLAQLQEGKRAAARFVDQAPGWAAHAYLAGHGRKSAG